MWYYESLTNRRPCNAWADDLHIRTPFRGCEGDMVHLLRCTIMYQEKRLFLRIMVQRVVVPYHPPSGEPVGICRPSVALPQKVQRFVVPHFSQTTPNHRPENLRSDELPTPMRLPLRWCALPTHLTGILSHTCAPFILLTCCPFLSSHFRTRTRTWAHTHTYTCSLLRFTQTCTHTPTPTLPTFPITQPKRGAIIK